MHSSEAAAFRSHGPIVLADVLFVFSELHAKVGEPFDKVLGLSRLVNHSPRAGQAVGAQLLMATDVEVVDVTEGRRSLLVRDLLANCPVALLVLG